MKTLAALADPHRRRIVEMLIDGEKSAGDLGAQFAISQPAVSRHLRVLLDAGLVRSRAQARRRLYRLDPAPLEEADAWFSRYRDFWRPSFEPVAPIPVRFPARFGPHAIGSNACGRRLRSLGLPAQLDTAAA